MNDVAELRQVNNSEHYVSGLEHICDELYRLDLLIQIRIIDFHRRIRQQESYVNSNPNYISEEEVLWLLAMDTKVLDEEGEVDKLIHHLQDFDKYLDQKVSRTLEQGINLPLVALAHLFNLTQFEVLILVITLAPELKRKYDRIYAYLQDDITRKRPSIDLILDLLCDSDSERWHGRGSLIGQSNLRYYELIQAITDPQSPSGSSDLSCFIKLNPRILNYLNGSQVIDDVLTNIIEIVPHKPERTINFRDLGLLDNAEKIITNREFINVSESNRPLLFRITGIQGIGKDTFVNALCHRLGANIIIVDCRSLIAAHDDYGQLLQKLFIESVLLQSTLCFRYYDCFLQNDDNSRLKFKKLFQKIEEFGWFYFLSGEDSHSDLFNKANIDVYQFDLTLPNKQQRRDLWRLNVDQSSTLNLNKKQMQLISERYELTPGQIEEAVALVRASETNEIDSSKLFKRLLQACREVSNRNLSKLSAKIPVKYQWADIVLPDDTIQVLKSICNQVTYYSLVFGEWGFGEKLPYGKGLSVLFSGVPGTGKTMASQVLANELELDLYKIDLSTVVSKYIGETEKNLNKVFGEAAASNAILFFDEADALFGKRTEISDSHDRYANLEVSYLLQRMEEYDGIVILATNLRNNMDDAFVRRIRFIIDFPFPDKRCRKIIWEKSFPKKAPKSQEIDYEFLAKSMTLSGGSIKNIVLNAAFQAANSNSQIEMNHLIDSAKIEYSKIGKLWDDKTMNNVKKCEPLHVKGANR